MQRYANIDGDSSVAGYERAPESITVQFTDGWNYLYTYASCGMVNCERMKSLAASGDGLNSFIMRNVRTGYERKWR